MRTRMFCGKFKSAGMQEELGVADRLVEEDGDKELELFLIAP